MYKNYSKSDGLISSSDRVTPVWVYEGGSTLKHYIFGSGLYSFFRFNIVFSALNLIFSVLLHLLLPSHKVAVSLLRNNQLKHIKMDNTTKQMLSQLHKEVINGIIANSFDFGEMPTLESIKNHWQYQYFNIANDETINDDTINHIINLVAKYYNR